MKGEEEQGVDITIKNLRRQKKWNTSICACGRPYSWALIDPGSCGGVDRRTGRSCAERLSNSFDKRREN